MKRVVSSLLLVLMAGCAVGQRFDYTRASPAIVQVVRGTVAVGAQDRRSYVVSGNKREQFVGLIRSGVGIPYDVVTASGRPFSQDVAGVLARALKQDGVSVVTLPFAPSANREDIARAIRTSGADRAIVLTINEWKTDSGPVTNVYCDLKLDEFDREGRIQRASQSRGTDQISGYFWSFDPNSVIAKGAAELLQKKVEGLFSSLTELVEHKTPTERLKELQHLLDQGLITQSEYEQKRKDILDGV